MHRGSSMKFMTASCSATWIIFLSMQLMKMWIYWHTMAARASPNRWNFVRIHFYSTLDCRLRLTFSKIKGEAPGKSWKHFYYRVRPLDSLSYSGVATQPGKLRCFVTKVLRLKFIYKQSVTALGQPTMFHLEVPSITVSWTAFGRKSFHQQNCRIGEKWRHKNVQNKIFSGDVKRNLRVKKCLFNCRLIKQ